MEEKIMEKLGTIEKLTLIAAKTALSVEEAAYFTNLSKSTIYKLIGTNGIPYYKGKKLVYFDKNELTTWMLKNRVKTVDELETEAASYIITGKRKGVGHV